MMKTTILLLGLAVAGCGGISREPPVSLAQSAGGGPPNQQPQSPNSLPLGSQVAAPFAAATGVVSTTQVGPGARTPPVTSRRAPLVDPGSGTAAAGTRPMGTSY